MAEVSEKFMYSGNLMVPGKWNVMNIAILC